MNSVDLAFTPALEQARLIRDKLKAVWINALRTTYPPWISPKFGNIKD